MASSQQQQGKPEDGKYLIFQSSDEKIYTIPQGSFGPAADSETARCILKSNRGVVFAILISVGDDPFKTCGPSTGPPPGPPPPPGR
jgi:hypothetical protein